MNDITQIAEKVADYVLRHSAEPMSLSVIERETREVLQEIGRQSVEQAVAELSKGKRSGAIGCDCGEEAKYVRQRTGCLHTLFGKVMFKRGYYLCGDCQQGGYEVDKALGLRPNQLSAELSRLVAMTGVQLPFQSGCDLFEALTLVKVSDQAMSKATRTVGEKVQAKESQEKVLSQDRDYLAHRKREARRPRRLYGAIDAVKVPIRDDPEQRWRDLKIGAWFEASGQPPSTAKGEWSIQAHHISYYADICPAAEFDHTVWLSAVARDAQLADELIILGDGADWIWNLVNRNFPHAIQILDWFHASEHLMPVAQAAFDTQEEQAAWVTSMKQLMWEGHIDQLIAACDTLAARCAADVIRTTANYFEHHKQRMRYAYFRQQGYQIGSGTIESAAKQIGLMRLKVPGARWNLHSAQLVAKARAAFLSDQWHSLPLAT